MASKTPEFPTAYDRTPVERVVTQTPCLCGCGEFPTRDTADFVPGHDARYKAALVAAHLAGTALTVTDKDGTREVSALDLASERDWQPFLEHAALRKARDDAAKAKKEAEKAAS
jgi:hypothetical protein